MLLEKYVEISLLYDFYGDLLSHKQKLIIDYYYNNNFSLGEIAEKIDISRQGVYDSLKRGEELLYDYDDKLKLLEKYTTNRDLIKNVLTNISGIVNGKYKDKCKDTLTEVVKDLEKVLQQL